jgi:hypothetical protein
MTKLILFLTTLLSFEKQKALTLRLVAVVFPGVTLYKSRPRGYKRARKVVQEDENPYLLHGGELESAERQRKAGE